MWQKRHRAGAGRVTTALARSSSCRIAKSAIDATRQVLHEGAEAVRGRAVVEPVRGGFRRGRRGACGGGDGIARRFGVLVFIGEEHGPPRFAHVPLHMVGEHAEEDVAADAIFEAVVDGPDLEVDGLERAERGIGTIGWVESLPKPCYAPSA